MLASRLAYQASTSTTPTRCGIIVNSEFGALHTQLDYIVVSQLDPKGIANVPLKVHKGGALALDARIRPYVVAADFYQWTQVCNVKVDPSLLTAVVERWRLETHTFHFNDGEATITLQDMSLLTGLPVEGMPVTGKSQFNFEEVCLRLLGVYPDCDSKSPAIASVGLGNSPRTNPNFILIPSVISMVFAN